jgi:hypothetical protein
MGQIRKGFPEDCEDDVLVLISGRSTLPIDTTADEQGGGNGKIKHSHTIQEGVIAMSHPGQESSSGDHGRQGKEEARAVKLPDPGLVQGIDPAQISSATIVEDVPGFDSPEKETCSNR